MSASERAVPNGLPQEAVQTGQPKDTGQSRKGVSLVPVDSPGLVPSLAKDAPSQNSSVELVHTRVTLPNITDVGRASLVYNAAAQIPESGLSLETFDNADISQEKPRTVFSGMQIEDLSERYILNDLARQADTTWNIDWDNPDLARQADTIANSVGEIEGVEVLSSGKYGKDNDNRCPQFTFGTFFQEEWSYPYKRMPQAFFADTIGFLQDNGYDFVEEPDTGDVAVYVDSQDVLNDQVNHFGVFGPDGKIVAKLGQGPVVRHEVDKVPSEYGSYVFFLRRIDNAVFPTDPEGFEAYLQKIIQLYKSRETAQEVPVLQEQDRTSLAVSEEHIDSQIKVPKRVAFQAFNPKRTSQSPEKLLALAEHIDPQLQSRFVGNPYSDEAISVLTNRYRDAEMSHPDIVRALILAEPEGSYDTRIQQLPRDERKKVLQEEFETSSERALKFSTYIQDKENDFWDMTNGEMYQNLSREIFGTDDQEQINTQFSRGQRRNFRLAIINFINNKNYMRQYLDTMKTSPEETVKSALKSA